MITELEPIWVGAMPTQLEMGKLYISKSFDVAIHLCVCGCGMHTVTHSAATAGHSAPTQTAR